VDKSTPRSARGRKPTGQNPVVTARLPQQIIGAIDLFAAREGVTRSEAIKRLVTMGLPRTIYDPADD
jgi:hypothetical protein